MWVRYEESDRTIRVSERPVGVFESWSPMGTAYFMGTPLVELIMVGESLVRFDTLVDREAALTGGARPARQETQGETNSAMARLVRETPIDPNNNVGFAEYIGLSKKEAEELAEDDAILAKLKAADKELELYDKEIRKADK